MVCNFGKAVIIAVAFASAAIDRAAAQDRPNFIWIMADDLGYGELGSYGQTVIKTTQLDRMAREGMRFTQFYAGATVCAPSRSVLMTGQHHGHTRVRGNAGAANPVAQALRSDDTTVAKVLQQAGYRTALIGKWGLGDVGAAESGLPRKQGFDEFFGYLNQHHAHNHFPDFLWRNDAFLASARSDSADWRPHWEAGAKTRRYHGIRLLKALCVKRLTACNSRANALRQPGLPV